MIDFVHIFQVFLTVFFITKHAQCSDSFCTREFFQCDSQFLRYGQICILPSQHSVRTQKKFNFIYGFRPWSPHDLGLRTIARTGQRLNQVLKNFFQIFRPSSLLTTVEYIIDHNSKMKNRTKKTRALKNSNLNIAHLLR